MNTLKLNKCAYIADNTHTNFYYSKKQYEECKKVQNYFKKWYDSWDIMQNVEIPFQYDDNKNIIIDIDGMKHYLNYGCVSKISDNDSIINKRKYFSVNDISDKCHSFHTFCNNSLYHNKLRSFHIDFYMTDNTELLFIRVHFKNNSERFIISTDNKLYSDGYNGSYKEITIDYLLNRLEIKSKTAINDFMQVINAIMSL